MYTIALQQSRISSLVEPFILLTVAVVVSAVSRRAMHLARWSDIYAFVLICAAFAGAIAFSSVRYRDFSPPLRDHRLRGMMMFAQQLFDSLGPFAALPMSCSAPEIDSRRFQLRSRL